MSILIKSSQEFDKRIEIVRIYRKKVEKMPKMEARHMKCQISQVSCSTDLPYP